MHYTQAPFGFLWYHHLEAYVCQWSRQHHTVLGKHCRRLMTGCGWIFPVNRLVDSVWSPSRIRLRWHMRICKGSTVDAVHSLFSNLNLSSFFPLLTYLSGFYYRMQSLPNLFLSHQYDSRLLSMFLLIHASWTFLFAPVASFSLACLPVRYTLLHYLIDIYSNSVSFYRVISERNANRRILIHSSWLVCWDLWARNKWKRVHIK